MLHPSAVIAICFAGMVCVAPVAFYLCWLATVNRRERPTVVNGAWDFAGVLAALSGFLLIGGMLVLGMVQSHPQLFPELIDRLRGAKGFEKLQDTFVKQWFWWMALFALYSTVLGLAILTGVGRRGRWLSVYNVDGESAAEAVEQALKQAGFTATRYGNLWSDQRKLIEIVPFHGTCHVTVRILVPPRREREEIERHLRANLKQAVSPDNPAAGWISALAGGAVLMVVLLVALMLFFLYFRL